MKTHHAPVRFLDLFFDDSFAFLLQDLPLDFHREEGLHEAVEDGLHAVHRHAAELAAAGIEPRAFLVHGHLVRYPLLGLVALAVLAILVLVVVIGDLRQDEAHPLPLDGSREHVAEAGAVQVDEHMAECHVLLHAGHDGAAAAVLRDDARVLGLLVGYATGQE